MYNNNKQKRLSLSNISPAAIFYFNKKRKFYKFYQTREITGLITINEKNNYRFQISRAPPFSILSAFSRKSSKIDFFF